MCGLWCASFVRTFTQKAPITPPKASPNARRCSNMADELRSLVIPSSIPAARSLAKMQLRGADPAGADMQTETTAPLPLTELDSLEPHPQSETQQRILIVRLSSMGDI